MTQTLQDGTAASPAGRRARQRLAERPLVWLLPLAVLLFLTYVYPALDVIRYSFTDATLLNPEFDYTAASYRNVTGNPDLPGILWVTFLFVVASVVLQLTLGLLVAMALHRGFTRELPGVSFVRVVILCSWIVPGVAGGIVWQLMFNEASYGFLNAVLRGVGVSPVAWLSDPVHRHLVGGDRQRLARHRLQHDPALRRPPGHPAQPLRGRRGRRRVGAGGSSGTSPCRSSGRSC